MYALERQLRTRSLIVAIFAMTLLLLAATANATIPTDRWLTLDANLDDWGVDPANGKWDPDLANCIYVLDDDETYAGTTSGGEWYDIEALYLKLENWSEDRQYLSWAMVTSYSGVETWDYNYSTSGYANNPVAFRNGLGANPDVPYRRHPVLALSFDSSIEGVTPTRPWQFGIVMAPGHDWTRDSEGNIVWSTSQGLADPSGAYPYIGGSGDYVYHDFGHGSGTTGNYRTYDAGGADPQFAGRTVADTVAAFSDTPVLYDVPYSQWRKPHASEFPQAGLPVDFDTRNAADLGVSGAVIAGLADGNDGRMSYQETADAQGNGNPGPGQLGSPWWQMQNYVWEGWIEFPQTVDFEVYDIVSFSYRQWCGNDDGGDVISYGSLPPTENSPELATWALLACTGLLGRMFRRRRDD